MIIWNFWVDKDRIIFLVMLTISSQKVRGTDRIIMDFCGILRYNACNKTEEEWASWQSM